MKLYILPVLAVIIGAGVAWFAYRSKPVKTNLLLSFSGAFLLALTFFDLLPEVYKHLQAKQTGLYIMLGILIQVTLEFFSKGVEHGHVHNKQISGFPWLLFISLCIHSFLEGFPISTHNHIVYGVLVHKIPIAIVVTGFLLQAKFSSYQILGFLLIFTIMTPLGTMVSHHANLGVFFVNVINALVIGIFFHISTIILFESSEAHTFNISKLGAIISGIIVAYIM